MDAVDTDHLLRLARDKSVAGRKVLAEAVSDMFLGNVRVLTDRERSLMFDILRRIVHDVELQVRRIIGEHLAGLPDTPRDLAVRLANDDLEVAYPMLTQSGVLQDEDLIEVVRHRTLEHQLAIAIRENVSREVSDALVSTGRESVIRTLLENPSARISDATMDYLVEQSRRVDTFQEPILKRKELTAELAKRMFMWVSAALRQYILDNHDMEPAAVDDLLEKTALQAIGPPPDANGPAPKTVTLAVELTERDMVTPELLVSVLQDGEVSLFVAMFRQLTGLREDLVMRILFEPGGEGLAIACKAVGIGKAFFTSIFALSRKARPEARKTLRRVLRKVLKLYDRMTEEGARDVLRRWRRNVGYLAAIRDLELGSVAHG